MIIRFAFCFFLTLFLYAFSSCSEQKHQEETPVVQNNTTVPVSQQQTVQTPKTDSVVKDKFPPVSGKELMRCLPKVVGGAKIMTPSVGKSETEYGLETRADIEVLYSGGVTARIAITDFAGHYHSVRQRFEVPYTETGAEVTTLTIGNAKGFQVVNPFEKSAVIRMCLGERFGIEIEILKYTQDFGLPSKIVEMLDLRSLETIAQKNK